MLIPNTTNTLDMRVLICSQTENVPMQTRSCVYNCSVNSRGGCMCLNNLLHCTDWFPISITPAWGWKTIVFLVRGQIHTQMQGPIVFLRKDSSSSFYAEHETINTAPAQLLSEATKKRTEVLDSGFCVFLEMGNRFNFAQNSKKNWKKKGFRSKARSTDFVPTISCWITCPHRIPKN